MSNKITSLIKKSSASKPMSQGTWSLIRKRLTPASRVGDGAAPRSPGVGGGAAQRSPGSGNKPRRGARAGEGTAPQSPEITGGAAQRSLGVRRGAEPRSLGNPGGAAPRSPGIAGGDAPRSLGDLRGAAPRSPGIAGGAAPRSLGGPGCSRAAEPRDRGGAAPRSPRAGSGASSCGSDKSNSSTFQPGGRGRRRLGTRVCSAFITYGRERALVLQGPGDGGTRRVSVAQVGAGGCAFRGGSGSLLPGKADWSQTALLQGSHFPGAGWTLGGFQPHFLPRPSPLFSQRHLPNSRHYYYTQGIPVLAQRAGKKPGGATEEQRGLGKGKRRERRRHAARSFAKPHGHHPHPLSGSEPIQPPRVPPQVHPQTHRWTSRSTTQSEAKRGSQDCSWSHPFLPLPPGSQFCRSARLPSQNPRSSPASPQLWPGPPPLL